MGMGKGRPPNAMCALDGGTTPAMEQNIYHASERRILNDAAAAPGVEGGYEKDRRWMVRFHCG